ncbi:Protein fam13a [Cichlidogyrus casuarinus]|uniref:Protein fam13a n=1 Tax=Cichlidogyrus casuarinus TaxID=1844966 RepID=A0ABD2PKU3_9PLAT
MERSLRDKRVSAGRPDSLEDMSTKQLEEEKLAMQKSLIAFETQFGRPKTHQERAIMRPLYNRYRSIKKRLQISNNNGHSSEWCEYFHESISQSLPI